MTDHPMPDAVLAELTAALSAALTALDAASSLDEVDAVRRGALGRSGSIPTIRRRIGALRGDARPAVGAAVEAAVETVTRALADKEEALLDTQPSLPFPVDITLPGKPARTGGLHPTTRMRYDLDDAFAALNFELYSGPEISSERYEFDQLNFPPDHPARESMDTYWLAEPPGDDRRCLRPHLTGASVRYLLAHEPPLRVVYPGRVYRNESTDARHERAFWQYEALIVDRDISLTAGKFLVDTILDTVVGRPVPTRMRTGYFPFVEPGFEIDMQCQVCGGGGCRTCRGVGWLEVMPGGCPHPNVLRTAGLDPDAWTGFYVNIGLDRLVMMRYGIADVRALHSADLRLLDQFDEG
jgi:phenylalanyl-tRNA synthetase alpha chain